MIYYLEIDGHEFTNCSEVNTTPRYRGQSVKTNLAGGYLIDRPGEKKISLTAKINMLTEEDYNCLMTAHDKVTFFVTYGRGVVRETKKMFLSDPEIPSPMVITGENNERVNYYPTITLKLEEI